MRRLTVTLLLVVLVAIFGLGLALDSLFDKYNNAESHEFARVQSFAHGLASAINETQDVESVIDKWPSSADYTVILENQDNLPLPASLKKEFETGEPLMLESDDGVSLHYFLAKHQRVLSIRTMTSTEQKDRSMAILFTGLFYLGTLLLVLLWLKPLLHRLNLIRKTTKSFGSGNLNSRINKQGLSYIRDIENDFNRMADKIQLLVNDNKLLTSAVSHDLRTPLARLRFGIDTFSASKDESAKTKYLARINNDMDEMENLVNSLLKYATLDNVMEGIEKQAVSLRELIAECTAQYYDTRILINIDDKHLHKDDQLLVEGCIEHLATMFNNLIQNAVEHANKKLLIELNKNNAFVELSFCDDGPGIPVSIRERILKPFQRGDNDTKKGYGLGLAIVARIVSHHGGVLDIGQSETLGGTKISVKFPV